MSELIDAVSDYCSSEYFVFLDPDIKEHAESLLIHWSRKIQSDSSPKGISDSLMEMGSLELSLQIKKTIPSLLAQFFQYLLITGKCSQAQSWGDIIIQLQTSYNDRLRTDGSFRGETFVKNYSDLSRNDPCPCGSGKKFKKCCMSLLL